MPRRATWTGLLLALLALAIVVPMPAHARDLVPPSLEPGPERYPSVHREADVPVELPDGTTLRADIYRPANHAGDPVSGRFPVVYQQTQYNKNGALVRNDPANPIGNVQDQLTSMVPLFMKHGYVQVIVDARGTGSSEGEWDAFGVKAQSDAVEILKWIRQQPFSDGKVVGYGPSCMGIDQLFLAAQQPEGLKAIFPIVPAEDAYRDVIYHGGAINSAFVPMWLGIIFATKTIPPAYAAGEPNEAVQVMSSRVSPGLNVSADMLSAPILDTDGAYDNDWYRERSPYRVVSKIKVPTFVTGGWYDLLTRAAPRVYDQLDLPAGKKQLLIGPWYHLTAGHEMGGHSTPPTLQELALAWFNRWARGERNGIENYGPVMINQLGSGPDGGDGGDRWETYQDYPRRDVQYRRFYLSGGKSGSAGSLNDGRLSTVPPADDSADTMPANEVNGVCTRGTSQWTAGVVPPGQPCESDNRSQEATSLTYTTDALKSPLHLSGPLSVTLNGSTTARDTTWIATVTDVAPDGQSSQITAGWLIQSRRALDRARTTFAPNGDPIAPFHPFTRDSVLPVEPGQTENMAIEIFATDAVIKPGHRLRVTISSGDVPHLLTPTPVTVNKIGAVNSVHRGPGSQSFLTAGVAPLGPEPSATKPKAAKRTKLQRCRSSAKRKYKPGKRRRAALARCSARYGS